MIMNVVGVIQYESKVSSISCVSPLEYVTPSYTNLL